MSSNEQRERARSSVTPFVGWRDQFLASNLHPTKLDAVLGCAFLLGGLVLAGSNWIVTGLCVGGVGSSAFLWKPLLNQHVSQKELAKSVREWLLIDDMLPLMTKDGRKTAIEIYFSGKIRPFCDDDLYIRGLSEDFASSRFRADWEAVENEFVEKVLKLWNKADEKVPSSTHLLL